MSEYDELLEKLDDLTWNHRGDADEIAEQAATQLRALAERIKELETSQQWIPVSERLPETADRYYMVLTEFWEDAQKMHFAKHDGVVYWDHQNTEKHHLISTPGHRVTHWMPLPAPPEGAE